MIALACDHGGFERKETIRRFLTENGYQAKDFGCYSKESADYPDFALPAANAVASGECECGILVCTTGVGMCIAANKVRGVRCALCVNKDMAMLSRQHNDANMLALGARLVTDDEAKELVRAWLAASFEGGRHERRVQKITEYESNRKREG